MKTRRFGKRPQTWPDDNIVYFGQQTVRAGNLQAAVEIATDVRRACA
jgi:hypothetical protein